MNKIFNPSMIQMMTLSTVWTALMIDSGGFEHEVS